MPARRPRRSALLAPASVGLTAAAAPCAAGSWLLAASLVAGGSLLGGGLSIAVMYAAYGANGGSYDDSVTKAATFVCLLSLAAGLLSMLRYRSEFTALAFISAQLALIFCGRCGVVGWPIPKG